jgi:hypothetical protein
MTDFYDATCFSMAIKRSRTLDATTMLHTSLPVKKENFNTLSHHEGREEEGNMKFNCHFHQKQQYNDLFGEKMRIKLR